MSSTDTIPNSPSKWIEEVTANPLLVVQPQNSVIVCKGLSLARAPVLQKQLWAILESHAEALLSSSSAGRDVVAALLRYGTFRTAEGVVAAVLKSSIFAPFVSSSSSATSAPSPVRGKKAVTAAAAQKKTSGINDDGVFSALAPFVEAAAFRVDIEQRSQILEPVVSSLSDIITNAGSSQLRDALVASESGVVRCILSILREKGGPVGDSLVQAIKQGGAKQQWISIFLELCLDASKKDKSSQRAVSQLIEAAKESEVAGRATSLSQCFWDAATAHSKGNASTLRAPFLLNILTRKPNCPVAASIAEFVTKKRSDIVAGALVGSGGSSRPELVAALLTSAPDDSALQLSRAVVASVSDWPKLVAASQLPQSTLGCFLALRKVAQRHPELIVNTEMASVLDTTARQFLKETLSAAEGAFAAVKMRLQAPDVTPSVVAQKQQQQQQQQSGQQKRSASASGSAAAPKMLRVVDSDDDGEEEHKNKTSGVKASPKRASPKPSPKLGASAASLPKKAAVRRGRDGDGATASGASPASASNRKQRR